MNKNKHKYFMSAIADLESAYKDGISPRIKALKKGYGKDYYYDIKRKGLNSLLSKNVITKDDVNKYCQLYDKVTLNSIKIVSCDKKEISPKQPKTSSYGIEVRSSVDTIEFANTIIGKISHYEYCISDKYGEPIHGTLTREQMDTIYSHYSSYGIDLTRKGLARELCEQLDVTLDNFQRILSVFKITKSSTPFAPHRLEENSVDKSVEYAFRIKEKDALKKFEEERYKRIELHNKQLLGENTSLKEQLILKNKWLENINFNEITPYTPINKPQTNDKALFIYLADMHIGARVDDDSLYYNKYDKEEVKIRLQKILNSIYDQKLIYGYFDRIIVCNLGDSLDGYNGQTTRGGHQLPQNMGNKDQFNVFIELMQWFFDSLYSYKIANHIDYYAVNGGNHDGDFGYFANKVLETYCSFKYPTMYIKVFEKFIDTIEYGKHTFCLCHGKDDKDMFKNLPLNLDDKTENYINQFLDSNNIHNSLIHFIKADLHQSNTNYGKRFRYKNVGSIFGSSKWIHHNFGNTKACSDIEIVSANAPDVLSMRLLLN